MMFWPSKHINAVHKHVVHGCQDQPNVLLCWVCVLFLPVSRLAQALALHWTAIIQKIRSILFLIHPATSGFQSSQNICCSDGVKFSSASSISARSSGERSVSISKSSFHVGGPDRLLWSEEGYLMEGSGAARPLPRVMNTSLMAHGQQMIPRFPK